MGRKSDGCIIYQYTNKINGKKYIGQTWYESERKKAHLKQNSGCIAFRRALAFYGVDNFDYKVLHSGIKNQAEANRIENLAIIENKTLHPDGYNLRAGALAGSKGFVSEETRLKLRISHLGKKSISTKKRKPITEETRAKLIEAQKRKAPPSQEIKDKISKKLTGHLVSGETKIKISASCRGKNTGELNWQSKKIKCIETGFVFLTITQAALFAKVSIKAISNCANKKYGCKTSGGYHWVFYEE